MTSSRGTRNILVLFSLVFLGFSIFGILVYKGLKGFTSKDQKVSKKNQGGSIGVVHLEGVILESQRVIEELIMAEEDPEIKAIVVRINSPGGAVAPTQEIYEEILRIDQKKPVYSSLGSIATSGGYYVAAATRKIFSNAGTMTGSIGVILSFFDLSKLYEFIKIDPNVIKSGQFKDTGSPFREMTPKERSMLEGMAFEVHQRFIEDILAKRKDKIQGDIFQHAQGQIFSGEKARELGLVDEIAGLWQGGRLIHEELKIEGDFHFEFIEKKEDFDLSDFLQPLREGASTLKSLFYLNWTPLLLLGK